MALELGHSSSMQKKARGDFKSRVRLEEGPNIHRILYGPIKTSTVFYPTLIWDEENQENVQKMRAFRPPESGSPLDVLASLERRTRKNKGEDNPRSSLDPTKRWVYLVINLESEDYPAVEITEYPWSVFDELCRIEKEEDIDDNSRLRYGLLLMYNVIITKTVNKKLPPKFGTKYKVEVDPKNKYVGKIPKSWWGHTASELKEKDVEIEQFFPEDMWEAIQKADIDILEETKPNTMEEITALLDEFPIFLGATNPDGSYRFPSIAELAEQAKKLGINHLLGEPDAPQLPSGKKEEEEEVEVEVEVEEKPKKKKKKKKKSTKREPEKEEPEEEEPEKEESEKEEPEKEESEKESSKNPYPEW